MIEIRQTPVFRDWLSELRDHKAREIIARRLVRVGAGLMGDAKFFDGIGELRVDYGPGYRIYFVKRGETIIVLLSGGDKSSQDRDIKRAIVMAQEV